MLWRQPFTITQVFFNQNLSFSLIGRNFKKENSLETKKAIYYCRAEWDFPFWEGSRYKFLKPFVCLEFLSGKTLKPPMMTDHPIDGSLFRKHTVRAVLLLKVLALIPNYGWKVEYSTYRGNNSMFVFFGSLRWSWDKTYTYSEHIFLCKSLAGNLLQAGCFWYSWTQRLLGRGDGNVWSCAGPGNLG